MCNQYPRPDAIRGHLYASHVLRGGHQAGRKYGCRGIAEIADLWPESVIAYDIAGPHNPAVLWLRRLEKWIYTRSDAVVFHHGGRLRLY